MYVFKWVPKFNETVDGLHEWLLPSEPQNLNDNSLTLISIGSLTGMGIGLLIASITGGSLIVGGLLILIGLHSLKKHWFLVRN